MPVRHGLTRGEIARIELARAAVDLSRLRLVTMEGWSRSMRWPATGRPWIPPSPNMPDHETALVYPGLCLVEATELSEGRGTTRPFRRIGAPGVDPVALADALAPLAGSGLRAVPTYFRPWHQKHRGEVCGGVELAVTDERQLASFQLGVRILQALRRCAPGAFRWREAPYEFVTDRPAIDLLAGTPRLRLALDAGDDAAIDDWITSWRADEREFRAERAAHLLYPEGDA
jgi:uncharacterized protein YbbC (DUF1343 family)